MIESHTGVLGATSLVGMCLLKRLSESASKVVAFTRHGEGHNSDSVIWRDLASEFDKTACVNTISCWISAAPIWVLPEYFKFLENYGVRKIVALSSTSLLMKNDSPDPDEKMIARRLAEGENALRVWAQHRNIEWVILRPTLIYGHGKDKNISIIAGFIRRFRFFPLLGKAKGLRQPVHADDVANACVAALDAKSASNKIYNIAGGETLSYREMVTRIFIALRYSPRFLLVPFGIFRIIVACLRIMPRYRSLTTAMALRMNSDLIFDISDTVIDLNFKPRKFTLTNEDLP